GFAGSGLGPEHAGDLFVGAARTFLDGGYLFEFKFNHSRRHFAFSDPALRDRVDDNDYKFDEGQSQSLVAGKNFGIGTDIVTGPAGNLYVTSLSNGAVYMISRKTPPPPSPGRDEDGEDETAPPAHRAVDEMFSSFARQPDSLGMGRQVHDPAMAASSAAVNG